MEETSQHRIAYLDGLRGVAILLVLFYHVFAWSTNMLPYREQFAEFVLFKYGYIGVQLFFMISGYVIYMTIEKSRSFGDFINRRWLRLFPAMLVVSLLIFFSATLLPERPSGIPQATDLISGLLFIDPSWLSLATQHPMGALEGSFWTLFVEVKFYLLFGLSYFLFGKRWAKWCLTMAFAISPACYVLYHFFKGQPDGHLINDFNNFLSLQHFGWFLIGVLCYELAKRKDTLKLLLTCFLGVFVAMYFSIGRDPVVLGLTLGMILIFVAMVYSTQLRKLVSARILLFTGFISYPLYLVHLGFVVGLIRKIGTSWSPLPDLLVPILPILLVVLISFLTAKFIEPALRGVFRTGELKLQALVQRR